MNIPRTDKIATAYHILCLGALSHLLCAAAFILDERFDFPILNSGVRIESVVALADGKYVVGGNFSVVNGNPAGGIVRFLEDGSIDPTFVPLSLDRRQFRKFYPLRNGKLLLIEFSRFTRINPDGSADDTFQAAVRPAGPTIVREQPDGKILIGRVLFGTIEALVRLNENGQRDGTFLFNVPSLAFDPYRELRLSDVLVQKSGKIIVTGESYAGTTAPKPYLARFHPDGTPDHTFAHHTPNEFATHLLETADEKLLLLSEERLPTGDRIAKPRRLRADGEFDESFSGPTLTNARVSVIVQAPGGDIYLGQYPGVSDQAISRLNPNGIQDSRFQPPPHLQGLFSVDSLGRLVVAYAETNGTRIARLFESGRFDPAFRTSALHRTGAEKMALEPGGTLLLAGNLIHDGEAAPLLRLKTDATVDDAFQSNIAQHVKWCEALAIDSSSNIYVGGRLDRLPIAGLARFKCSGELDETFPPVSVPEGITVIAPASAGMVLVAGTFERVNNRTLYRIARIRPDGVIDELFNIGDHLSKLFSHVTALVVAPDGKIYVAGRPGLQTTLERVYVVRLNPDGSLDPAFAGLRTDLGFDIFKLTLLPDGKILVAAQGGTITPEGLPRTLGGLFRLNQDGSKDLSFDSQITASSIFPAVYDVILQENAKILIAGYFQRVGNQPARGLARLLPDGSPDGSFAPQFEEQGIGRSIHVHPDGSLYLTGDFTSVSGEQRFGLVRFLPDLRFEAQGLVTGGRFFRSLIRNETGKGLTLQTSIDLSSWTTLSQVTTNTVLQEFVQPVREEKQFFRVIAR